MTETLGWDITPCWETRPCIPVSVVAADVCVSSGCKLGSGGVGFTSGEDCTVGFGLWWDSPKLLRGVCVVGNIGRWPCFSEPERETLEWEWRGGGRPMMAAVAREGRSGSVRGSTYPITLLGMLEGGREVGVWGGVDSVSKNLINVCENDVCQKRGFKESSHMRGGLGSKLDWLLKVEEKGWEGGGGENVPLLCWAVER